MEGDERSKEEVDRLRIAQRAVYLGLTDGSMVRVAGRCGSPHGSEGGHIYPSWNEAGLDAANIKGARAFLVLTGLRSCPKALYIPLLLYV